MYLTVYTAWLFQCAFENTPQNSYTNSIYEASQGGLGHLYKVWYLQDQLTKSMLLQSQVITYQEN